MQPGLYLSGYNSVSAGWLTGSKNYRNKGEMCTLYCTVLYVTAYRPKLTKKYTRRCSILPLRYCYLSNIPFFVEFFLMFCFVQQTVMRC